MRTVEAVRRVRRVRTELEAIPIFKGLQERGDCRAGRDGCFFRGNLSSACNPICFALFCCKQTPTASSLCFITMNLIARLLIPSLSPIYSPFLASFISRLEPIVNSLSCVFIRTLRELVLLSGCAHLANCPPRTNVWCLIQAKSCTIAVPLLGLGHLPVLFPFYPCPQDYSITNHLTQPIQKIRAVTWTQPLPNLLKCLYPHFNNC